MRSLRVHRIGMRGAMGLVAVVLLVLLAVALSGCQIQLGLDTKVNDNGSGTFGFRLAADKEILDLMGQQGASSDDLFGELKKGLPKDWKTQEGTDPNGTKWVTVSVEFKNTDELQTILKNAGSTANLDLNSFKLTQKKGFFSTTTEYSLKLDMGSALSGLGDIGGMGGQLTPSVLGSILVFENRVTLPGSIKANNATKVEGNTLIWQPQLSGATEMTATSQSIRWSIVYILIGAVVVLIALLVVIIILLARRGRRQAPPADAVVGGYEPAPEAPPADAYAQGIPAPEASVPPVAPMVAPVVPAAEAALAPTEVIPVAAPAAPVAPPEPAAPAVEAAAPVSAVNPLASSIPLARTAAEPAVPEVEAAFPPAKAVPAPEAEDLSATVPAVNPFASSVPRATTAPEPEEPEPRP